MAVTKKLYRSCKDRILGGVGGGLGEYLDVDPTLIRLAIALAFLSGIGLVAYLLAWIIIPLDPACETGKTGAEEIKEHAERVAEEIRNSTKDNYRGSLVRHDDFRFWFGLVIVFFAVSILLENLFGFGLWHNFWPIILVALGVVLIAGSIEKK